MKPNGKMFAVRMVLFAVCAVCLLSDLSKAEIVRGTFKLPVAARWGKMMLAPGEYDFVVDTQSTSRVVTVHSKTSGWTGMVLVAGIADTGSGTGSSLKLVKAQDGMYVKTLSLNGTGMALDFAVPKSTAVRLARSASAPVVSASGAN